jgi:hypothetical protein
MKQRRVSLLVGKKSYNILTSVDDDTLKEVYDVLHDAAAATDPAMDQDERLFLASMTLANEVVELSRHVRSMTGLIEDRKQDGR